MILLAILGVGCLGYMTVSSNKSISPHSSHIEELSCDECHVSEVTNQTFPDPELCLDCHDDLLEEELNVPLEKEQIRVFTFSHSSHELLECEECHTLKGDIDMKIPENRDCEFCHRDSEIRLSCKNCHAGHFFVPSYHNSVWAERHTRGYGYETEAEHAYQCEICHRQDFCKSCHNSTQPKSHTSFFRVRGHGINAEMNRESCGVCHIESFCVRCHNETKPVSHIGVWEQKIHGFAIINSWPQGIGRCGLCHKKSWCIECHDSL